MFKKARILSEGASFSKNINTTNKLLKSFEQEYRQSNQINNRLIEEIQDLYTIIANGIVKNRDIIDDIIALECQVNSDNSLTLAVFGKGQTKLETEWMKLRWRLGNVNMMTGQTLIQEPNVPDDF